MNYQLDLQRFAGDEGAVAPEAAGAETAAAETTVPAGPVNPGDTLADGTTVKNAQVAAALEKQMRKHPELRQVYGRGQAAAPQQAEEPQTQEKTIDEEWEEAKKGRFADQYGRDVQNAIRDRFKNQQDMTQQMNALEPMLKVLRERAGVGTNEELIRQVMDDDSLYEEAASEAGMTIPAYREFMQIKQERDAMEAREQESLREAQLREHFGNLQKQAAEMQKTYPEFDLMKELQNEQFMRLTSPEGGLSVEDAFFAVHHRELAPQMMAYGMERAKQQLGQTIQAQRKRPAEGAMRAQGQPAGEMHIDPRQLTKQERAEIKRQVRMGRRVSFD